MVQVRCKIMIIAIMGLLNMNCEAPKPSRTPRPDL